MIQKFFSSLYEVFLGSPKPAPWTQEYREIIFPNTALYLIVITLALVLVYYYLMNKYFSTGWYKTYHWVIFMALNASIAVAIPYYQVLVNAVQMHSYANLFAFLNVLYSLTLFIGLSLLLKGKSVQAWTTPVKWPHKK